MYHAVTFLMMEVFARINLRAALQNSELSMDKIQSLEEVFLLFNTLMVSVHAKSPSSPGWLTPLKFKASQQPILYLTIQEKALEFERLFKLHVGPITPYIHILAHHLWEYVFRLAILTR